MEKRFVGKVALVTGATNGIGRAAAVRLAAEGALVGVNQRPTGDPSETLRLIKEAGGEGFPVVADMRDPAQVAEMVREVARRGGRLDYVVSNAAINLYMPWTDITSEVFDNAVRDQRAGNVDGLYRGRQADDQGGSRRGDLHGQLDLGPRRLSEPGRLLRYQRRHQHAGQGARGGPGRARHPCERRSSREPSPRT